MLVLDFDSPNNKKVVLARGGNKGSKVFLKRSVPMGAEGATQYKFFY